MKKIIVKTDNTSQLYQLVKSLSGYEKAYLVKLAKRHTTSKPALHIKLLHLLFKTDSYNEKFLIAKLGINSGAQFSALKKHLFTEILDALIFLNRNRDTFWESDKHIMIIELLIDRKLFKTARAMIAKHKKSADEGQYLIKQLRLLKIEFELLLFNDGDLLNRQNALIRSHFEQVELSEKLNIIFRQLLVLRSTSNNRITENETTEASQQALMLDGFTPTPASPPIIHILYYACRALASYMQLQELNSRQYSGQALEYWQKFPQLVKFHSWLFIEDAITAIYNSFAFATPADTAAVLSTYKKLSERIGSRNARRWQILEFNTELKIYHKTANYEKVNELLEQRAADIELFAEKILPYSDNLTILSSLAISYFVLGDFNKADELIYKVKTMLHHVKRPDILYFVQVFHLIIMYEMKDKYRLITATDAAYKLLYGRKLLRPFEKEMILFIKSLAQTTNKSAAQKTMMRAMEKLESFQNDSVKKMHFFYFNYYGWLQSKLDGVAYTDYVRAHFKNKTAEPV